MTQDYDTDQNLRSL